MTRTKTVKKEVADKIKCLKCEKIKASNTQNFYANTNPLFSSEKLEICKDCINEYIGLKESKGYFDRVRLVLALLDKPLLIDQWELRDRDWSKYIPPLSSLTQYKGMTYADSTLSIKSNSKNDTSEAIQSDSEIEQLSENEYKELVRYWGRGYSNEDYYYLEEEKVKLMSSFECPDYGMEMIMRDICFLNLEIEKVRQEQKANGSKEISNLIKTRSDLMNDAKMKPIQATGAEANDQVSFGVLIKKWENEKPVPQGLDDDMKNYIDVFMIGHLAKMEGLSNEMTEKYDKAMSEYTIDFDEINKNKEFEDD